MKNIICLCTIILVSSATCLFAQDVNFTKDSLAIVFCKKWKLEYAIEDGVKIAPQPGLEFNFEFKRDNTFKMTGNGSDMTGTWNYDPNKKKIRLKRIEKSNSELANVISLREDEFIMLMDMKEATPSDPTAIKMFFIPGS
jgi:Lipocalin-like domain (DUF4923)